MKSIETLYKIGRGPSSSHTMGPAIAAGFLALKYQNRADQVYITLYNSLALTGIGHLTHDVLSAELSAYQVEINTKLDDQKHPNALGFEFYHQADLIGRHEVVSIGGGDIIIDGQKTCELDLYPNNYLDEIIEVCVRQKINFFEYVKNIEGDEILVFLGIVFDTMMAAVANGLGKTKVLPGELQVKRRGHYLFANQIKDETPSQTEKRLMSAYAFAVGEENASGGIIVTAPTCGACGVIPAILYHFYHDLKISKNRLIEGLAVAGLFGNLIRHNASISGAVAGCQAEIGSACSMAAALVAHVRGYNLKQIEYAAEMGMEHHLGLTCDPVGGYVQVPCIERNAVAALRAIDSADLAYLLASSSIVSFDTVIKTMHKTGLEMNPDYKETATGGLAYFVKGNQDDTCW